MKSRFVNGCPCSTCHGIIFTIVSCYMEHSQANIDALRSDYEEIVFEKCVSMFHMALNYIPQEEFLYGT